MKVSIRIEVIPRVVFYGVGAGLKPLSGISELRHTKPVSLLKLPSVLLKTGFFLKKAYKLLKRQVRTFGIFSSIINSKLQIGKSKSLRW